MGARRPTKSELGTWNPSTWKLTGGDLKTFASGIRSQADKYNTDVHNVGEPGKWVGAGQKGAEARAQADRDKISTLCNHLDDAGAALETGGKLISDNRTSVFGTVDSLYDDDFSVSDDWTVTDTSALAKKSDPTDDERIALNKRAERAANDQASLRSRADTLGSDDQKYGKNVADALTSAMSILQPTSSASGEQAKSDYDALKDGTASSEQLRRLHELTTLTPQQVADLEAGKEVVIPKGQMDYLQGLIGAADKDGGLDGFLNFGGSNATIHGGIANALQIVSNPQVRTNQFHYQVCEGPGGTTPEAAPKEFEHGGLASLPGSIRKPLQDPAGQYSESYVTTGGYPINFKSYDVSRIHDLSKINDIIKKGDKSLRVGTDIDRGLFARSADLAEAAKQHEKYNTSKTDFPLLTDGDDDNAKSVDRSIIVDQLDSILETAGSDHVAVHDAIVATAPGGQPIGSMPGRWDSGQGITSLLTLDWDDDKHHAVERMLNWMGDPSIAATHSGDSAAHAHQATVAGEAATGLAHITADHAKDFVDNPFHNYGAIGNYNARITYAMADGMSPHFGTMTGADPSLFGTAGGFHLANQEQLSKILQVLDSDPDAARTANTRGIDTIRIMQHYFSAGTGGEHTEMGQYAGRMSIAMEDGLNLATADMNDEARHDAAQNYANQGIAYDTTKSVVDAFLGPVSPSASTALSIANPALKSAILGPAPWTADITSDQADMLQAHEGERIELSKGRNVSTYVNLLNGMHEREPQLFDDPSLQKYLTDGQLDPAKFKDKSEQFIRETDKALGSVDEDYTDAFAAAADNRLQW